MGMWIFGTLGIWVGIYSRIFPDIPTFPGNVAQPEFLAYYMQLEGDMQLYFFSVVDRLIDRRISSVNKFF